MKHIFIFIWVSFACNLFAQNFQLVYLGKTATFHNNATYNYFCQAQEGRYFALSIDSVKTVDDYQVLYDFNTVEQNEGDFDCYYKTTSNWAGYKFLIKPNGDNLLFTKKKDTVLIKATSGLNAKWKFFKESNGNYFEAEVISISSGDVLGETDNIKTIRLLYKDANNQIQDHLLNGTGIVLSETHGVLQMIGISDFPNDEVPFVLAGLSSPKLGVQNITAREVFDFNVGDEFHVDYALTNPPYSGYFGKQKRTILSKYVSGNEDTLIYEVKRIDFVKNYNWENQTKDSSVVTDIVKEKIIVSEYKKLNLAPLNFQLISDNSILCHTCQQTTNINGRLIKNVYIEGVESHEDSCYSPIIDYYSYSEYIEGLGGGYYDNSYEPSFNYRKLVYYKKGSEVWGEPLTLSTSASTTTLLSYISPNPFKEDIKFELKQNGTYELELSTVYGSVVKRVAFEGSEITLHNEGWQGVYLYRILSNNIVVGSGKVVAY